jgi:hypothetical protein
LLRIRTQVLSDNLRATLERRYPGLEADPTPAEESAA